MIRHVEHFQCNGATMTTLVGWIGIHHKQKLWKSGMMDNSPFDTGTVLLADSLNSNTVKHRQNRLTMIGSNGHFLTCEHDTL